MKAQKIFSTLCLLLVVTTSSISAQTYLTNGLIAFYPFNGNAIDASGNSNNGVISGATLAADRFGNSNSAYFFNGINNYIDTTDSTAFRNLRSNYTITCWINSPNPNKAAYVITKDIWGNQQWAVIVGYISNKANLVMTGKLHQPSAPTTSNKWDAIGFTYNGTTLTAFKNGIVTGSAVTNATLPIVAGAVVRFGTARGPTGSPVSQYVGSLDEIRIYNRALSTNEMQQLYNYETLYPLTIQTAIELRWNTYNGQAYQVQSSADLTNWANAESPIVGLGGLTNRFYSITESNTFFRLKLP